MSYISLMSADTLCSDDLKNMSGETLGKIQDFVLDIDLGRIVYAVISLDGFADGRLLTVPLSALTLNEDANYFILDMEKERFKSAPGFNKNNWPDKINPEWEHLVHKYYQAPASCQ